MRFPWQRREEEFYPEELKPRKKETLKDTATKIMQRQMKKDEAYGLKASERILGVADKNESKSLSAQLRELKEVQSALKSVVGAESKSSWVEVIGTSRSGRTELLRAIAEHPDCAEMEVLTPAAFRGGLKKGPKVLERINSKLVITKDIASILTSRKDLRTELFGVLRGIKDGKLTADFGSEEGHLVQEARFDWILAATSSGIEQ